MCVCKSEFVTLVEIQCFSLKPTCPRMEGYRNVKKEHFLWLAACYLMQLMERNGTMRVPGWKVAGDGVGKAGFSYGEYGRCEARCLLSCPMLTSTSAPSSMCVCACVFTYACLPHRQIPPPLPSNNCSHSMFEHKHTPLSLSLQLSVCAPASMWLCAHTHTHFHALSSYSDAWLLLSVISVKAANGAPIHFKQKAVLTLS